MRANSPADSVVGAPNAFAAPFRDTVSDVMVCVEVSRTSVPSGVLVLRGSTMVPVANVETGCKSIHCCSETGVGTAIENPVDGTNRLTAIVGAANCCWKYDSNADTETLRASPFCKLKKGI